ncbi:oligosaccharide repeat unit polymerase [Photobacterium damselae]|uniref:O-antigen polymerase n=1 Tax=Photobacterium damselae TaxID=38293 RepID=UPI002542BA21
MNVKNVLYVVLLYFFSITLYFITNYSYNICIIPLASFILGAITVFRFRYKTLIAFILFFILLFPFDFLLVYYSGVKFFPGYDFNNINIVFLCLLLFQSTIFYISPPKIMSYNYDFEAIKSDLILYILIFIYAVGVLLLSGGNIFNSTESYDLYQDNLNAGSGLYEYLIMLSCLIVLFKKNKKQKIIFIFFLSLYVIKTVLFGFRVQAIMQFIVLYIVVINRDLKPYMLFIALGGGFLLILSYGFMKEGMNFDNINLSLLIDTRYGYAQSHQQGVLSSSTAILNYTNEINYKLFNIPSVFMASILPRGLVGDIIPWAYPAAFVKQFQYTPGGGLFIVQIYFLFGFTGLFISSILITFLINKICNQRYKNRLIVCFSLILVVFFPRWISYDFFNYFMRSSIMVFCTVLVIDLIIKGLRNE